MHILHVLINVYLFILIARAVSSWFPPPRPGTPLALISQVLRDLTEPVLMPLRRVIPPAGPFDLSFIVLIILLQIVNSQIR